MCILVAAGTDIRDYYTGVFNSSDFVEVPAGSGRIYRVQNVDDIAKGFANEHRFAVLFKVPAYVWPAPMP